MLQIWGGLDLACCWQAVPSIRQSFRYGVMRWTLRRESVSEHGGTRAAEVVVAWHDSCTKAEGKGPPPPNAAPYLRRCGEVESYEGWTPAPSSVVV